MQGTLYIVGTPIGNLEDLTPGAAAAFGSADFVAAEDTRVTLKLLNHLGLKKPMVSYYEHNLKERGDYILSRIEAGESCALCSDAGMPAISDPGEVIVRDALARGIRVAPVPGPSACVTALAVSGQATGRFVFEGFLPMNARQRRERLAALAGEERTVIFYEAPHKLRATLADLAAAFGPERGVTLARELTKLHEEVGIEAGESCALCSDAGMPAISDPGEVIVRDALARGIRVAPVPGPSACVTALAVSGQATGRFVFEGFLPMNARQRRERLAALAGEERTVIFYEAPHKLRATLADLAAAFGPERGVTLARELTKLHEEVDKTTLGAAAAHYAENAPRGEYVLVMEGAAAPAPEAVSLQEAAQRARRLIEEGLSPTAAAKQAAAGTPYSKSEVYRLLAREGET